MDECENLPKNMCDSCIIQLNVAYNLKKNAIQSDMKLRQYMIEFGMNVTSYTACSINTVSVMRPPAILMPTSTTSESVTITTAKSTTVGPTPTVQIQPPPPPQLQTLRPFPVMPVIIKEEPVDYEVMSDITVETNTEAFEEHMRNHRNRTNGIHSTTSTSTSSNKSSTPLPVHSMVSVNTKSLLLTSQESTDSEYISAYMLTPSSNSDQTSASSKSAKKRKSPESISLAVPKLKTVQSPNAKKTSPAKVNITKVNTTKVITTKVNTTKTVTKPRAHRSVELTRLIDDSLIQSKTMNLSPGRQTRQQLKEIRTLNSEPSPQRSRSRNGNSKMDYKSFFSSRVGTPPNGTPKSNRRKSVDSPFSRRKGKSPRARNQNKSKSASATINGKRRSSVAHNRTRI